MFFRILLMNSIELIGFILYGVAILTIIRALCTYDDFKNKSEITNTIIVITTIIISPICGYFIRDYAQGEKRLISFEKVINSELSNDNREFSPTNVSSAFYNLRDSDKIKAIELIYKNFYDSSLSSRCDFLNTYRKYTIPFVSKIREQTEKEIENIYTEFEQNDEPLSWQKFHTLVPIEDFLSNAPKSVIDREFCKWNNDESAWQRVLLLDSIYLSKVYLERYPNGHYECSAKKIILDDEYLNSEMRGRRILSNYCGNTIISVINRSSYEIGFHYSGTFAKGTIKISANSRRVISLPNGYYAISIFSQKLHTKGINERITCDGVYISYDLELKQDHN